ncbi:MAG TPA: HepT-like ribonuclease domain-containing protein [Prolixibacteraceae bacterium]
MASGYDRSIQEIYGFFPEKRDFNDFISDLKTRKACERNIEIIGEALNRILKIKPTIEISDSRKIVDTRNRIIHGYDSVTADVLWLIINRYLPILEREVENLLQKTDI